MKKAGVKPMQIAMKNEKFANGFSKLGEEDISHEIVSTINC